MKESLNDFNDVFRSFLVKNADYSDEIELPIIRTSLLIPNRVIPNGFPSKNGNQLFEHVKMVLRQQNKRRF